MLLTPGCDPGEGSQFRGHVVRIQESTQSIGVRKEDTEAGTCNPDFFGGSWRELMSSKPLLGCVGETLCQHMHPHSVFLQKSALLIWSKGARNFYYRTQENPSRAIGLARGDMEHFLVLFAHAMLLKKQTKNPFKKQAKHSWSLLPFLKSAMAAVSENFIPLSKPLPRAAQRRFMKC